MYNELVEERLSQFTRAVKINELKEEKEALTKELREAKTVIDGPKPDPPLPWFFERPDEGVVKAKEQKNDSSASSTYVPVCLRNTPGARMVGSIWPKDPADENDRSTLCRRGDPYLQQSFGAIHERVL